MKHKSWLLSDRHDTCCSLGEEVHLTCGILGGYMMSLLSFLMSLVTLDIPFSPYPYSPFWIKYIFPLSLFLPPFFPLIESHTVVQGGLEFSN